MQNNPYEILGELENIIKSRRANADAESSYVASLIQKGDKKVCEKIGEEATEVIIAALTESKEDLENEAADLLFHLMVALELKNTSIERVCEILTNRFGLSGIEEKNIRKK